MKTILAHDIGTSGNKATLFHENGEMLASEVYSYEANYYHETWAEQDPADWWKAICVTTSKLIRRTGVPAKDIAAVSFSGQMMGCLCVDSSGNPLRSSIIWADQRAQKQTMALAEKIPPKEYFKITGHRNSASNNSVLTKIAAREILHVHRTSPATAKPIFFSEHFG